MSGVERVWCALPSTHKSKVKEPADCGRLRMQSTQRWPRIPIVHKPLIFPRHNLTRSTTLVIERMY